MATAINKNLSVATQTVTCKLRDVYTCRTLNSMSKFSVISKTAASQTAFAKTIPALCKLGCPNCLLLHIHSPAIKDAYAGIKRKSIKIFPSTTGLLHTCNNCCNRAPFGAISKSTIPLGLILVYSDAPCHRSHAKQSKVANAEILRDFHFILVTIVWITI